MALILLSPPAVEPVSIAEFKEYLRVDQDDTSQDNLIASLGMAARSWAETYMRRRCVQQTWRRYFDVFPGYYAFLAGQPGTSVVLSGPALLAGIRYALALDFSPVNAILNFQYQNANGTPTVLDPATDFIQDLQSNPARLMPPFGQMWPVARVIANAVQVDYQLGYAMPLTVSASTNQVTATGYVFEPTDVNRPITIPGAGLNGAQLNTVISAIASPPSATATLRFPATNPVTNVSALLVNNPNANPGHWPLIQSGIKALTARWYEIRTPDESQIPAAVKAILSPVRELRF